MPPRTIFEISQTRHFSRHFSAESSISHGKYPPKNVVRNVVFSPRKIPRIYLVAVLNLSLLTCDERYPDGYDNQSRSR